MKITLSKSQWEVIGKKAGWMKKADIRPANENPDFGGIGTDIDETTGITKDQMKSYVRIQNAGKYNMLTNGDIVAKIIGISRDQYLSLLENYDRLLQKWPELEG